MTMLCLPRELTADAALQANGPGVSVPPAPLVPLRPPARHKPRVGRHFLSCGVVRQSCARQSWALQPGPPARLLHVQPGPLLLQDCCCCCCCRQAAGAGRLLLATGAGAARARCVMLVLFVPLLAFHFFVCPARAHAQRHQNTTQCAV